MPLPVMVLLVWIAVSFVVGPLVGMAMAAGGEGAPSAGPAPSRQARPPGPATLRAS